MQRRFCQIAFLLLAVFGGVALKSEAAPIWVLILFVSVLASASYLALGEWLSVKKFVGIQQERNCGFI